MSDDETRSEEAPREGLSLHVPKGIRIFPNVWPGKALAVQPGDVTQFVPMGFCMGGPVIMRPWDSLKSAMSSGGYYGANPHSFHPFHGAPVTDPGGGVLYFASGNPPDKVIGALELMSVQTRMNDYAVFVSQAEDPQKEGFLVHCRIMRLGALGYFFHTNIDAIEGGATRQPMTLAEFVRGFIRVHEDRYGTGMNSMLYGAMGGDGDWAKECLAFGFMVENQYHGIYRIWTRAWLVTK